MSFPPQGLDKADVLTNQSTLLTRLSATRAGYLDRIPVIEPDARYAEEHVHSRERWFGISGDQAGTNWALADGLTVFQAASGDGDFGTEIKVLGSTDTPAIAGKAYFDFHRIFVDDSSATSPYVLRFIYGTGTVEAAEAAGQYTDVYYKKESAAGRGAPADIRMPLLASTTKVWAKVKNATNLATLDFFFGLHEYA